jgi:hypothetical protein
MIPDQFDSLSKSLRLESRRGTLRLLASAPLIGTLTVLLPAVARTQARKSRGKPSKHRGKPGKKQPSNTCPDCTCPPDPRIAAVDACRAARGIPVEGECSCGWFNSLFGAFGCPEIPSPRIPCACFATIEMTGFCGEGVVPAGGTGTTCSTSDECPTLPAESGMVRDQACVYFRHTNQFECWTACQSRPA